MGEGERTAVESHIPWGHVPKGRGLAVERPECCESLAILGLAAISDTARDDVSVLTSVAFVANSLDPFYFVA
jgi:hypothetical protein